MYPRTATCCGPLKEESTSLTFSGIGLTISYSIITIYIYYANTSSCFGSESNELEGGMQLRSVEIRAAWLSRSLSLSRDHVDQQLLARRVDVVVAPIPAANTRYSILL